MSWITCHDCGAYINSDDDPDCFVEVGNMRRQTYEIVLCEACRVQREIEQEHDDWMALRAEAEWETSRSK